MAVDGGAGVTVADSAVVGVVVVGVEVAVFDDEAAEVIGADGDSGATSLRCSRNVSRAG